MVEAGGVTLLSVVELVMSLAATLSVAVVIVNVVAILVGKNKF